MTDNKLMVLPDVQSSADRRNIPIRRVGVKGIRTPILVKSQSGAQHTVADVEMYVSLPEDKKGTHMSRFWTLLGGINKPFAPQMMVEVMQEMLASLYSDGRVAKAVQAIRNAGKTYEKDGALWFKSTDYGDDKDRVMRKADGSYTYFVPDVAYHLAKFERGFNRALNIQGSDHHGTVARVRAGIQAASGDFGFNIPKTFPEYMLHKMLQVVKDGQPVKMSKRSGTYVTLSDLVNWVGKDAARLFMVNRRADAEFVFDVDLALSQSDENPVYYLQYAHARICSVFAQAQEKGIEVPSVEEMASEDLSSLTAPTELRLMSKLSDFPTALANGTEDLSPLALVTYLKELAADFHSFYNAERVLVDDEKLRNARLALLVATRQVLRNGLEILGVSAPERLSRADQPADSTK